WNIYTNGLGDGSEGFQDTPAASGSVALFRFNKDTDLDGYSDRSEERLGTDPNDPADHPKPELIAGVHSIRAGNHVTATLSLLNTGLYDAYGVEAVMIAPDDSVSITNNTVGGSGRVRAQKQVIVGSRIKLQSPLPDPWTQPGHAVPAVAGYYTGQRDRTYTFTVQCGNPAGCDVGDGSWTLAWDDGVGSSGTLDFGAGYASPTFLDVGALGVKLALYTGKVYDGESFTVEARTPRDTFQYTINREPYTEPIVIVSYNDPQGNHKFVTPVRLSSPTEDLVPHSGKMIHGGAGVEIVTEGPFTSGQPMETTLVVQAPARLVDAHLFLEFIDPNGTVVREEATTVTLEPGPNVVSIPWNSNDFNPAYDPDQDYIVMAFFTDWQGNILDTAGRPLSSFQEDPKPTFAMDEAGTTWDFGNVPQGTILTHTFALANTGLMDLKAAVVGSGMRTDQNVPGQPVWIDTGLDVAAGDAIGIRASGTVCYAAGSSCYGPDGDDNPAPGDWTAPGSSQFSLIAKIGDGAPFFVGSTYVGTADRDGRLYLGTNDRQGTYGDNGGSYQAHIEIQGVPTAFQNTPSFSIGPADAMGLDVTIDTHYLPVGSFDRTILVRTSDPAHPTQTFRVMGTVEPYVDPARAMGVSPYRPWDQRVVVAGDHQARDVVTFDDAIAADAADVHPLLVYDDTRRDVLGAGREVACAVGGDGAVASTARVSATHREAPSGDETEATTAPSASNAPFNVFGDGRDGDLVVRSGQTFYVDNVRAAVVGTAAAGQQIVKFSTTLNGSLHRQVSPQAKHEGWIDYGLEVAEGDTLVVRRVFPNDGVCYGGGQCYGPNGSGEPAPSGWLAPGLPKFSLVGRIDNGAPFFIGENRNVVLPKNGTLFLGLNDCIGCYGDNSFQVDGHALMMDIIVTYSLTPRFSSGDEILIIQMSGPDAGKYEFATVSSVSNGQLTLASPLQNTYISDGTSRAQIIRVPHYRNVIVKGGGRIAARQWDGTSGGVLALRVRDDLVVESNGRISVSRGGFKGGIAWYWHTSSPGYQGASYTGASPTTSQSPNAGGGGGGQNAGGGGGGYGTSGSNGMSGGGSGLGGNQYGSPALDRLFLGSGGGGTSHAYQNAADGGRGGGIALIIGRTVTINGALESNGQGGGQPAYTFTHAPDRVWSEGRGGGGGSGGSIKIIASVANLGNNRVTAVGGPGGREANNQNNGGNGGAGRIRIEYCDTFSGSTNPPASVAKINFCYGTIAGRVFRDNNGNGSQDAGELGLNGVSVRLSDGQTTTTDSNGNYSFRANAPASYTVSVTPPAGYDCVTPCSVNVSLQVGQTTTVNFALRPRASVAGKVFHDTNNNGVQDAGEPGIAGVAVTLSTGATRTTAGDGSYSFDQLLPGSYSVSVTVPDGYVNTTSTTISCNLGAGDTCNANFGILQYAIEKVLGSDHQNRFFLPESFRGGRRYWVQYGRRMHFDAAGQQQAQVQLPMAHYGNVTMDVWLTEPVSSNTFVQLDLDVGCDGISEWGENANLNIPTILSTNDLALGFNRFLETATPDANGMVAVPLCLTSNIAGTLFLTNLAATPDGVSDVATTATDITLNPADPVEGDIVNVQATLHNPTVWDTGGLVVSYYATRNTQYYLGSAFVPNVPAGGAANATIPWNTLGFTGTVPVRVVVDPYNRIAETDEANNEATAQLTIRTRPDLRIPAVALSDDEPMAGETVTVTVTLRNAGQTAAGAQTVALYQGNPDAGGTLVGTTQALSLPGGNTNTVTFTWTPTAPGSYRLFVRVDQDDVVDEYDEGNNDAWRDVYVGLASPVLLDSGGASDVAYAPDQGYGYLNGQANTFCGTEPDQSQRSDPAGRVEYRFDHLLPGHFYHLDITLYECDGLGRQERIEVDDNPVSEVIDLSDGQVHRLSIRLDPAFYADRQIVVAIQETLGNDALVSQVNLHDVDYRYADAGGSGDEAYTPERGWGYLDGVKQQPWGTLPYQSRRIDLADGDPGDDPDSELRYRFDGLNPDRRYQLHLTFYQGAGSLVQQSIRIDGLNVGALIELNGAQREDVTVEVPYETYALDRSIVVSIIRTNGSAGAFVNEISLEEKTLLTLPRIRGVQVSNVSDNAATISWITDIPANGVVHYGPTSALGMIGHDDRGPSTSSRTHHVTLRGLAPSTTYFFYVASADAVDDNGGFYYRLTTGPTLSPPSPDTVYGQVFRPDGVTPAEGALVYITLWDGDGQGSSGQAAPLSALVDASGYWNVNLGNARTQDHSQPFVYSATSDWVEIRVVDGSECSARQIVDTGNDSPAPSMTLACPTQVSHNLWAGWNLVGLNVEVDGGVDAEGVLQEIAAQGGDVIEVDRWLNGGWDAHIRGLPFNNFQLELGQGYFFKAKASSVWQRVGRRLSNPLLVELYPGWNLVSFPKLPGMVRAEDVLDGIAAQGGACIEIDHWEFGGWQGHIKDLPFNNFELREDEGYFVKCSQRSTYLPQQMAMQGGKSEWPAPTSLPEFQSDGRPGIRWVRVSNVREGAFSVVWWTERPSDGWVEYGEAERLEGKAYDDRGEEVISRLHHVTVKGLRPGARYAFRVRSGEET
ncbi:MAG: hypothetical protein J7M34_13825, partial [Anaerolineae bacterium]|nr:hypothetical protein [Anaerolineae bacterium]